MTTTIRAHAWRSLAAALFLALPAALTRAATFVPPPGFEATTIYSSPQSIGGFDVAGDGSLVLIENSAGGSSTASRLVRITPDGATTNTLHLFESGVFGSFVKVQGSTVYFGQGGDAFNGSPASSFRIMSTDLVGATLSTNIVLQNYDLALAPSGDRWFVGAPGFVNGVYRLDGPTTNLVVNLPDFSAGLAFTPNGDLYLGQSLITSFTPFTLENNLYRFTHDQLTNAVATGTVLGPGDGVQVGTNLLGAAYLAADDDGDLFLSQYGSSALVTHDAATGVTGVFGSGDGAFTYLRYVPGTNGFEPHALGGGTLYGYLSDFSEPAFNAIVAVRPVPEPGALGSLMLAALCGARRRRQ